MSPIWGHAIGVVIVLLLLVFSGIWLWAWLPYHKKAFDALARLPSEDNQR
jgi:cbb3-type cytochrome oxidase subunit 3